MQIFTVSLYHDTRRKLESGSYPIKIRVTFKKAGKWVQRYFPANESVKKDEWERMTSGSVRGDLRNAWMNVNKRLSEVQYASEKVRTFEELQAILDGTRSADDFISFALVELNNQRGLIKPKTWTGYENRLENLKKYKTVIPFNEIDHQFLSDLKRHWVGKQGRKLNGCYQDFACIKKFYRIAVARGKAFGNPFESFQLTKEETVRDWLNKEELQTLYNLTHSDKITDAVKNTLRHFLFCCFTGLRFGDKKQFNEMNIEDGRIHLRTSKRGKFVIIPLNDQAKQLLPFIYKRKLKQSNSRVNEDLKTAMKAAGIKKHITFHCSRHTFAINCILLGIELITVRDWLGHSSVTTTEVYAKIAAKYKDKSMEKFNNFF